MSTIQQLFAGIEVILYEVVLAVLPIVLLFILLNFFSFRIRRKRFWNILKGFLITTIGLVLFLHGVNMAYVPVGQHLGSAIAAIEQNHLLIPLGFIMGFLVGFAEPAIHVMVKQVEELSEGRIRAKVMLAVISIGIGLAVGLSMWRLLAGFSLYYFLIPGYGLAFILGRKAVSYTHLRAHETDSYLVCRLLLEKKNKNIKKKKKQHAWMRTTSEDNG